MNAYGARGPTVLFLFLDLTLSRFIFSESFC